MRAVWSWLLELVELEESITAAQAAEALTQAGLEVEGIGAFGEDVSGVVIAEVAGKRPHPDAERLTVVEVRTDPGGPTTEVVCGAGNVPEPGGRVLWARPGAQLPGGLRIEARSIKGVRSPGMLCSEKELGLGEDGDGIVVLDPGQGDAPLGALAVDALGLRDVVLEVSAPANRPDVLGHLGIARELAALFGGRVRAPAAELGHEQTLRASDLVRVTIEDPQACPRYIARVIDGLSLGLSPLRLRQRLRAVGVRPISNVVDVTNYVMFELGQPLHAFDCARIAGGEIRVRPARPGERLTTLDGVERALEPQDLLICDPKGPVALAGVMGGADSEVSSTTRRVLLESASFASRSIRRTAARLGLHSEASYRFERHVDPEGAELASRRAAAMLAQHAGGRVALGSVDVYPRPATPRRVAVRASRASSLTGVSFTRERAAELLQPLGLAVRPADDGDTLEVTCPTYRPDLEREVDLIEEILRRHGFANVPATLPRVCVAPTRTQDPRAARARHALVAAGLCEAITYGFTSPERLAALRFGDGDERAAPVRLRNPMSAEQSVMRTSLLPNLLAAAVRNLRFGVADIALFEIGSVFLAGAEGELPAEPVHAAGVLAGPRPGWRKASSEVNFFDAKGMVEHCLAEMLGERAGEVRYRATDGVPYMHPGVCAEVFLPDGTVLGEVGEIHPATRQAFDLAATCFGFELDLDQCPAPTPAQLREIPRYPAVTRDVSFFCEKGIAAAHIAELVAAADQPFVERVQVLEDYRDPSHVAPGKKGMLWSITYRCGERSLTDAEVDAIHESLVSRLIRELGAERR